MGWLAWKMLTGDRMKFAGIVFGVAFATLLMAQQLSVFVGIMQRTANQVADVRDAAIWVMDERTRMVDEAPGLPESALDRVRSVPGVAWAVRAFKGQVAARLADGSFRVGIMLALDDDALVGAPGEMLAGSVEDLRAPDAVIVDRAGYEYMFPADAAAVPTRGYRLGQLFAMNDRRARLAGVCRASAPFTTMPVLFTRFSLARGYLPKGRNMMNYVLASPAPDLTAEAACARIEAATGYRALTRGAFEWLTIHYFLTSTGIPINFAVTILLGFVVGIAIAGQTFYLFALDNLRQFAALKAMGLSDAGLCGMILSQALAVGATGYGIGIGITALYFEATQNITHLAGMAMPAPVMAGTAVAVLFIVALASLAAIRRVLVLEPAAVFRC
jgi:putative ABC transport system permease protein